MMPPVWMKLRVRGGEGRGVRLWIPLILLWPVVFLLAVVGLVFLVVISLVSRRARALIRSIPAMFITVCSLRGLKVDVNDGDDVVFLEFT